MTFIKTISESKFQTFKQCKLKYRYRYVERLPEPGESNTEALHFGSFIHKVLEEGITAKTKDEMVLIAEEVKGTYNVSEKYKGKDLICIENFLKFKAKLGKIVGTELVYEVPVAEGISINGIIDLIVAGEDGGYLIIDYKTSKREKTKVDLYQDSQLKGYVFMVSKMFKVPVNKIVAAHYYPLTNNFVHVQYSQPQINAHVKKIIDEVWRIRKTKKEDMRASRNEFCNWCPYKSICYEFNDSFTCQKRIEDLKNKKAQSKDN